jgi:hypothetical protein
MGNKIITYLIYGFILWWLLKRMGYNISSVSNTWKQYPGGGGGFRP